MDATDVRDLINHYRMFGPAPLCKKRGSGWWVEFRGHGFPTPYATKAAAMEQVGLWVSMVRPVEA